LPEELKPTPLRVRKLLGPRKRVLMNNEIYKLTADVADAALWSAQLQPVCPDGIKTFFVMDQDTRSGP
jgi:hypothetical protein